MITQPHKLKYIYTSNYRYSGENRVDITVKGNVPIWKPFAPTWGMVIGHKKGMLDDSGYISKYLEILEKVPIVTWDKLLTMEEIVLVCFCPENSFCHRNILTNHLLNILGSRVAYLGWKA